MLKKIIFSIFIALPLTVSAAWYDFLLPLFPSTQNEVVLGEDGTLTRLDQWTASSSPFNAISPRVNGKNIYAPFSTATTSKLYSTTICLTGDTCRTTWPSAGASFGQAWEIGGNGNTGFLAPTTTQKVWVGQASSTIFSANQAEIGGTGTTSIFSNGTVGLSTTTPWANFAINPTAGVAANKFVVGSSTATSLVVDNAGKVGIGLASPSASLEITGNALVNGIRLTNPNQNVWNMVINNTTFGSTDAKGANFLQDNAGRFRIYNNNINAFNITSTGLVGIGGNYIPLSALDVRGGIAVGGYSGVTNTGSGNIIMDGGLGIGATSLTGYFINGSKNGGGSNLGTNFTNTDTTAGPNTAIYSSLTNNIGNYVEMALYNSNATGNFFGIPKANLGRFDSTATFLIGSSGATSPLIFATNSLERGRFISNGNFGIGTTTPTNALLTLSASSTSALDFLNVDGPTTGSLATTTLFKITANGKVGIGTTTPATLLSIAPLSRQDPIYVSTTTATAASTTLFAVDKAGWIHHGGGTPTLSSCGTGPALDANATDQSGTITFGATATGCTLTFYDTAPSRPHCVVTTEVQSLVNAYTYTVTNTSITIAQVGSGGTVWDYYCGIGH